MRAPDTLQSRSSSGLVYVVVWTYTKLKEDEQAQYLEGEAAEQRLQHPEKLLLVFGIALISSFFMYSSLLFGGCFYCKQRAAFTDADRAAELPAEFSETSRQRPNRRPGRAREYTARSAL